jgi:hypothetical protein
MGWRSAGVWSEATRKRRRIGGFAPVKVTVSRWTLGVDRERVFAAKGSSIPQSGRFSGGSCPLRRP